MSRETRGERSKEGKRRVLERNYSHHDKLPVLLDVSTRIGGELKETHQSTGREPLEIEERNRTF